MYNWSIETKCVCSKILSSINFMKKLAICAGIMLIELKENRDSLEVFTHLAHLFPEEPSFRQQVEVLKRHLEKQRQKAAQGSAV